MLAIPAVLVMIIAIITITMLTWSVPAIAPIVRGAVVTTRVAIDQAPEAVVIIIGAKAIAAVITAHALIAVFGARLAIVIIAIATAVVVIRRAPSKRDGRDDRKQ